MIPAELDQAFGELFGSLAEIRADILAVNGAGGGNILHHARNRADDLIDRINTVFQRMELEYSIPPVCPWCGRKEKEK